MNFRPRLFHSVFSILYSVFFAFAFFLLPLSFFLLSAPPSALAAEPPPPGTSCQNYEFKTEPHPLRPAPGLTCTPEVPTPWNLSCANDILPALTVNLPRTKVGAYNCSAVGDFGRERCTRKIEEYQPPPLTITIDLTNLELPMAGVASNTRVSDILSDSQKMTNYTSWYLQSAVQQADQEPLDYLSRSDQDRLLSYSGPIKKLIPQEILDEKKKQLISDAVNEKTYNQIIGYVMDNKVIGRKQARQLFSENPLRTDIQVIRLADMQSHLTPVWDPADLEAQKWHTLWQQVPFTSGQTDISGEVFPTACVRSETDPRRCRTDPTVIDAVLEITSGVDSFRINFPHLIENNSLLSVLQDVLISNDIARTAVRPAYPLLQQNLDKATRLPEWTQNQFGNYPNAGGCVQDNALWNPGDNLEAGQNSTAGQITGRLTFKKDIEYTFEVETKASLNFIEACWGAGRTDCPYPLPSTVPVEITAPVPVHIRHALLDEIADRAVIGPGSVFKALYPDIPTTVGELVNRPAESAIGYSCRTQDGSPCRAESTSHKNQSRAFFPWLGTMLELFHQKIQTMLNPLSGRLVSVGLPPPGSDSSSPYANSDIQSALAAAAERNDVPLSLLQAIYEIEGTEHLAWGQCAVSSAGAVGPMQVIDADGSAYWDAVSAEERQIMNLCNPGDAAEAAARIIVYKVGGGSASDADWIKRAAKGYYGSCEPDSVTEDRWGEGIGYCDFVLYRMNLCLSQAPNQYQVLEAGCDGE